MLKRIDSSRKAGALIYCVMFAILFVCNSMTAYIADDYGYCYIVGVENQRLEHIWQIIPSMIAHEKTVNGRLVAHSLVQLFSMMPRWVFDIVNAGMFCCQVALLSGLAMGTGRSNLRTAAVFSGIWVYELAFGQVNFWQDGAVNYLWSAVFLLLFLRPFALKFMGADGILDAGTRMPLKAAFLILSFLTGAYSETVSAAAILISVLLLILDTVCNHRKLSVYGLLCTVAAFCGYVSIYLAPAQWNKKASGAALHTLAASFTRATAIYASYGVLIAALVVLLVICVQEKGNSKRVLLALTLVVGSLAANYIMMFAKYYVERSSLGAFILLLAAVIVLIPAALEIKPWKTLLVSAMIILTLSGIPAVCTGVMDNYTTYIQGLQTEAYIMDCVANGEQDVKVPVIYAATKYNGLYGNAELSKDSSYWVNILMARYYGLASIAAE